MYNLQSVKPFSPQPVKAVRKGSSVLNALKEMIYSGLLAPGDAISEAEITKQLMVSPAVMREAVVSLEYMGLVDRRPNRGTAVKNLSKDELRYRVAVRIPLEVLAVTEAGKRVSESDLRKLERLLANFADENTPQADFEFHQYIWQCSGNPELSNTLEVLTSNMFGFIATLRKTGLQKQADRIRSHEELLQLLRERDSVSKERIKAVVENHVDSAYRGFLDSPYNTFLDLAQAIKIDSEPPDRQALEITISR